MKLRRNETPVFREDDFNSEIRDRLNDKKGLAMFYFQLVKWSPPHIFDKLTSLLSRVWFVLTIYWNGNLVRNLLR